MDRLAANSATGFPILTQAFSIAKSIRSIMGLKLAAIDIAAGQDQFLACLDAQTFMSVGEVATALQVRPSTVSKMTDRMVDKGLAERTGSSSDARRSSLRLTPLGEQVQAQVLEIWTGVEVELGKRLGDAPEVSLQGSTLLDAALVGYLSRMR